MSLDLKLRLRTLDNGHIQAVIICPEGGAVIGVGYAYVKGTPYAAKQAIGNALDSALSSQVKDRNLVRNVRAMSDVGQAG